MPTARGDVNIDATLSGPEEVDVLADLINVTGFNVALRGNNSPNGRARLHALGTVNIDAAGELSLLGGGGVNAAAIVQADAPNTINVTADNLSLAGGGGNNSDALFVSNGGAGTVNITANSCTGCGAVTPGAGTDAGLFGNPLNLNIPGFGGGGGTPAAPLPESPAATSPIAMVPVADTTVTPIPQPLDTTRPPLPSNIDDIINQVVSLYDEELEEFGDVEGADTLAAGDEEEEFSEDESGTQCT